MHNGMCIRIAPDLVDAIVIVVAVVVQDEESEEKKTNRVFLFLLFNREYKFTN